MIPISRWLAQRDAPSVFELPPDTHNAEGHHLLDEPIAIIQPSEEERLFQRGFDEGMAAAEAAFAGRLDMERRAAAAREEELVGIWTNRCSETVCREIAAAFEHLQSAIEQAVHDVLLPFLEDGIRGQAVAELHRMILHELAETGDQPVEVRAPAPVLAHLRDGLERLGIGAAFTEAGSVEVRTRDRAAAFESMAGRWIESLRGPAGHE